MTEQPQSHQHPEAQPPLVRTDVAHAEPVDVMDVLDLDVERSRRAAEREGKRKDLPVRFGGQVIAVLPVEMPVDWLAPVRTLDEDLTIVLRESLQAFKNKGAEREQSMEAVVDMLAANPRMPVNVLDAVAQVAKNCLGESGYAALMAQHPSLNDLSALAKGVLGFYGVTLGEALPPSDSSTSGGQTSNTTSGSTSDSTPETSGQTPSPSTPMAVAASSGSVGS